jgi:hypothetical protein
MKAVLATVLAVFIATTSVSRSAEPSLHAGPPEGGLEWRCDVIPAFASYCEAIRAAVEERDPEVDAPATVTSHEAGTRIALDFGEAAIFGTEIADLLLAADSLLPDHVGTIEIRNLLLQGKLELNRTDFRRALRIDQVRFAGADGACVGGGGIGIDGSHFHMQVRISRARGCGNVQIIASQFARGLLFDNHGPRRSSLRGRIIVNQSRIDRELFVNNWSIGSLSIALSSFDAVNLSNLRAVEQFQIRDSEVFSLSAYKIVLPTQSSLRGNHVRDSVNISELYVAHSPLAKRTRSTPHDLPAVALLDDWKTIHFADNEVEGRLVIGIRDEATVPPVILARDAPVALRLHHNRVKGSADVFVADALTASIDLRGSKFGSELLLTRACMAHEQQDEAATPSSCQKRCGFGPRDSGFCAIDPTAPAEGDHGASLDVQLAAVEVDTLVWNLRGDEVRWSGPGLRYDYWDPEPRRGQRPYETRAASGAGSGGTNPIQTWLAQLERGPDAVDPLTHGAAYLKAHGHVAEAAGTRLVALRSNLWGKIETEDNVFALVGSFILFIVLFPVGWGARPEWALLGMTFLVPFFWGVYALHSWRSDRKWPRENQWHSWDVQISRLHLQDAVTEVVAAIINGRGQPAAIGPPAEPPAPPDTVTSASEPKKALRASVGIAQRDPPAFSQVPGFNQYNNTFPPRQFSLFLFSLDAMLPVISLHHFDRYYPSSIDENFEQTPYQWVRWLSIGQHGIGWWLSTVFVASLFV